MLDAYLYNGLRTPFGRNAGALATVRPDDMLGGVIRAAIDTSSFSESAIDDVIIGCGNQAGEDSRCVARHALLRAGLPIETPGTVLQRNCGSGLGAIISAAHAITCGEGDVIIAGGVESMTRAPFVVGKSEQAFGKQFVSFDSALGARFPNPEIEKEFGSDNMPQTADNLAEKYQLSRLECDTFAYQSQSKYAAAKADSFFDGEITAVTIPGKRKKPDTIFDQDEFPRPGTELEKLATIRALNQGGVTTAANASGINDGAVAMIVASRAAGDAAGAKPMARILSSGVAGVEPRIMGYGPVPAAEIALKRAGLTLADMDVIEINEAFAAQVLACAKGMKLSFDDSRINPNGGAITVGHPLGASGPRIALTAARQLERQGGRYALVSMCIGLGQGIAMVIERV
jgi:acetyl-CoA C-acetyltransferase|tara:strand:- start:1342 stop:2544 length:1203 start_codon:yes stop_codon:yes gene_type:complete